ncbi:MAG: hypothetical protein ACKO34_01290 [Vampirovibrionales bacterium]
MFRWLARILTAPWVRKINQETQSKINEFTQSTQAWKDTFEKSESLQNTSNPIIRQHIDGMEPRLNLAKGVFVVGAIAAAFVFPVAVVAAAAGLYTLHDIQTTGEAASHEHQQRVKNHLRAIDAESKSIIENIVTITAKQIEALISVVANLLKATTVGLTFITSSLLGDHVRQHPHCFTLPSVDPAPLEQTLQRPLNQSLHCLAQPNLPLWRR